MKVLYLYTEVMGYTIATINQLVQKGAETHVVHFDNKKLTPYTIPKSAKLHLYPKSKQNRKSLVKLVSVLNPDITVVAGWVDKDYLHVASILKMQGKTVVCGLDGQWRGTLKQYIGSMLGSINYFKKYFTHAWVSGVYQFEYARKFGFKKNEIIFDFYSADISMYSNEYQKCINSKKKNYPHRFLYVGRFEKIKGLKFLLKAWDELTEKKRDWELHLIGNGSLQKELTKRSNIVVKDFMQPEKLINEIKGAGCFILPSIYEPWGVVIHEFAAAGLPLIVSSEVGSAKSFLINKFNGFYFNTQNYKNLRSKMLQIIEMSDEELQRLSRNSNKLSSRISPKTSANNLLSLIG